MNTGRCTACWLVATWAVRACAQVMSPMAGTMYRSPAPGEGPFVKEGDKVTKGQTICIIEAMKLMNEIEVRRPPQMHVTSMRPVGVPADYKRIENLYKFHMLTASYIYCISYSVYTGSPSLCCPVAPGRHKMPQQSISSPVSASIWLLCSGITSAHALCRPRSPGPLCSLWPPTAALSPLDR